MLRTLRSFWYHWLRGKVPWYAAIIMPCEEMNMVFDASVRRLSCGKLKSETTTTDAINVHIEQRKTYRRPSKCAKLQGIKSHILISVTFCVPLWCGGELGMSLNGFQLNSNGFIDSTEQAANAWIKSQYLQLWNVSFFSYNAGKSWKPIRRINLMNLSWQIGFVRHKNSWRNYNSQISHPAIPIQYALICGFWWNVIHQLIKKKLKNDKSCIYGIFMRSDEMRTPFYIRVKLKWNWFVSDIASYPMKDSIYGFLSNISFYSYFVAISFLAIYSNRMKTILIFFANENRFLRGM